MWIQLCIHTSDVEIIFTPVKMNITLYKYLICSFQGTNCKPMVYVTSNRLRDFSTNLNMICVIELFHVTETIFYNENNFLFAYIMPSKMFFTLFLDNFDYLRFRNYPMEIKGFEPLTPCLQGRCSPS